MTATATKQKDDQEYTYTYLDEPFDEAEIPSGRDNLPDGKYTLRVDVVDLGVSTKTGNSYLKWDLIVVDNEELEGKTQVKFSNLPGQDDDPTKAKQMIGFLKKDLVACGVDIYHAGFRLGQFLEERRGELLDKCVEAQVKTNGQNVNVYFNKLIGSGESSTISDTTTLSDDTDPFAEE